MDNPNYAESVLGYNIRNDANFFSRWFFMYLNPTFSKGAKARSFQVSISSDFSQCHLRCARQKRPEMTQKRPR